MLAAKIFGREKNAKVKLSIYKSSLFSTMVDNWENIFLIS